MDESYFGAKRIRGKHGRGAYGKTPDFSILQCGGKVSIQRSSLTVPERPCKPLSVAKSIRTVSFIPLLGAVTTAWLT